MLEVGREVVAAGVEVGGRVVSVVERAEHDSLAGAREAAGWVVVPVAAASAAEWAVERVKVAPTAAAKVAGAARVVVERVEVAVREVAVAALEQAGWAAAAAA